MRKIAKAFLSMMALTSAANAASLETTIASKDIGNFGFTLHDSPRVSTTLSGSVPGVNLAFIDHRNLSDGAHYTQNLLIASTRYPVSFFGYRLGRETFAEYMFTPSTSTSLGTVGLTVAVPSKGRLSSYVGVSYDGSTEITKFGNSTATGSVSNMTGVALGNYFGVKGALNSTTTLSISINGARTGVTLSSTYTLPMSSQLRANSSIGISGKVTF